MYMILFVFIRNKLKFAWILVERSIFVRIFSRIIGGLWIQKEFLEKIIGRFKSIIDLSLIMIAIAVKQKV